ncbi:MAG TPA: 16S rRNA (cytosine(967)-C(5))-methyltransferase RsmB, partial [Candidatus Limnocylindria bacterium]|nr:16S rRNA (cytosine(967)-C(5))-methyltransferase RsmB [Candidatus Limnocylindria bacterium]
MVRLARLGGGSYGRSRVSPARLCAYRVLRRVSADDAFADRAFNSEAERHELSPRDRAFAQQLVFGTLQRQSTLDYVLTALSARPVGSIDPPLRDTLRLGLFQLLFMSGVPDHAAVEQTVELAKLERGGGHRFANAVMRRATREAQGLVAELTPDSPSDAAVLHSHPEWLVRLWWDALGREDTLALLARDNEAPESAVRANELVITREELRDVLLELQVRSRPVPELPEGLVLETPFDVHGSLLFEAGALTPQSRASMLVARVLGPQPGETVLDLCAAPGAKSTHIAALMRGRGRLVAVERNAGRCDSLQANCRRMGAHWVDVRCEDATRFVGDHTDGYDRVLLDPPCSDLGTLQARPDARWRKEPDQVRNLGRIQGELIEAAATHVRPGGTLVYSTCTISPSENEDQMHNFLARHTEFEADDVAAELPAFRHPRIPRFLQLLPHVHGTDGFFIARLRRVAEA